MADTSTSPDPQILEEISEHVDILLERCGHDSDLQMLALKFQVDHAAAQSAFERQDDAANSSLGGSPHSVTLDPPGTGPSLQQRHLQAALRRAADFAFNVVRHVHTSVQRVTGASPRANSTGSASAGLNSPTLSVDSEKGAADYQTDAIGGRSVSSNRSTSVDDLSHMEGTPVWIEGCANLFHSGTQILILTLLADRITLQKRMRNLGLSGLLAEALSIEKEYELRYFAEGYKTDLMNLASNYCYGNADVAEDVVASPGFFKAILEGTRVDEDNPGLIEWAKFTIRSLCVVSERAREELKALRPVGLDAETQQLLSKANMAATVDSDTGVVRISQST